MSDQQAGAWIYDFVVETRSGKPVPAHVAEELFHRIVNLVAERDLQMGRGFRPDTPEENERHRKAEAFVKRLEQER